VDIVRMGGEIFFMVQAGCRRRILQNRHPCGIPVSEPDTNGPGCCITEGDRELVVEEKLPPCDIGPRHDACGDQEHVDDAVFETECEKRGCWEPYKKEFAYRLL